jgi:hypothetical protein
LLIDLLDALEHVLGGGDGVIDGAIDRPVGSHLARMKTLLGGSVQGTKVRSDCI